MSHRSSHRGHIHERFLRHIWSRQYLDESSLRTIEGTPLKVLNTGELNLGGGPDFLRAKLKIGNTIFAGDVEIHRSTLDWVLHQHEVDPRYNSVVLHVVLEGRGQKDPTLVQSGRKVPVLVLEPFLSESIRSIWQKTILDERARRGERIRCYSKNNGIDAGVLGRWVSRLAIERLELKLRRFEERLRELAYERKLAFRESPRTWGEPPVEGYPEEIPPPSRDLGPKDFSRKELWEQVLYEGIMEGLGYSKNEEPFIRLAQSVTLEKVRNLGIADDEPKLEALLFGVAGLLPKVTSLTERESRNLARLLIRQWNELRKSFRSEILHSADWEFFPTRPANFPTLRLAAGAALIRKILSDDLFRKIIQIMKSGGEEKDRHKQVVELFSVETPPFWHRHYDFDDASGKDVRALGSSRTEDIIINTVLPVALLYARVFKDKQVRSSTLKLYEVLAPASENSITRLMEEQLLRKKLPLDSASRQQGIIQLYKFYCTEARCQDCEIGRIVFQDEKDIPKSS